MRKLDLGVSFYPRKFVVIASGALCGVLLSQSVLPWAYAIMTALCVALLALITKKLRVAALPLFFAAMALFLLRAQLAAPAPAAPSANGVLTGRIADAPVRNPNSWALLLKDATFDGAPVDGKVMLTVADRDHTHAFAYGQTVYTPASLAPLSGKRGDGLMDMRLYYLAKGVGCTAFSIGDDVVTDDAINDRAIRNKSAIGDAAFALTGALLSLRARFTYVLTDMLGPQNGPLAAAMLHGDTTEIPGEALSVFRDAGIAHLLAVSGLHVGIFTGVMLFLLRKARPLPQLIVMAVFLALYCLFCALSPSTVRASVMALCMLCGKALGRRNDPPSSLAFAFVLLLSANPYSLYDTGFMLSFTAVLGILLLHQPLTEALKKLFGKVFLKRRDEKGSAPAGLFRSRFPQLKHALISSLALSFSGQIATLPVTAAYFSRLPLFAVFANLLVVPLAALVVIPAALALPLYPILPQAAGLVAQIAGATLSLMRATASFAASPGALFFLPFSFLAGILYFAALAFVSPFCRAHRPRAKRRLAGFILALCLVAYIWPMGKNLSPYVTVLDMPKGTYCVHAHSPGDNQFILYGP
ncbi:MAG: ComEC family competence protein, partial [Clostridiales bacterium]|nr:ComEC family competence protein [Clostridiales bacterium]